MNQEKPTRGNYRWKKKGKKSKEEVKSPQDPNSPEKPKIYKISREEFCGQREDGATIYDPNFKRKLRNSTVLQPRPKSKYSKDNQIRISSADNGEVEFYDKPPVQIKPENDKMEVEELEVTRTIGLSRRPANEFISESTPIPKQTMFSPISEPLSPELSDFKRSTPTPSPLLTDNPTSTPPLMAASDPVSKPAGNVAPPLISPANPYPFPLIHSAVPPIVFDEALCRFPYFPERTQQQEFKELLEYCSIYLLKKIEKGIWFEGIIKDHIRMLNTPKPLTKMGHRLIENGIFLAAYIRYQIEHKKMVIGIDRLLVTYFALAKTDIQVLQKLVHILKDPKCIAGNNDFWPKLFDKIKEQKASKIKKCPGQQQKQPMEEILSVETVCADNMLAESKKSKRVCNQIPLKVQSDAPKPPETPQNKPENNARIEEAVNVKMEEDGQEKLSTRAENTPKRSQLSALAKQAAQLNIEEQILTLRLYLEYENEILCCRWIAKILKRKVNYIERNLRKIFKVYSKRKSEANSEYVKRIIVKLQENLEKSRKDNDP